MSIKTLTFPGFFLTAGLLIAGVTWQSVKAQESTKINCNNKFRTGSTYKTSHQGLYQPAPTLDRSGEIKLIRTYKCTKGTCFQANMKVDNYGPINNDGSSGGSVEGYWQGSSIQFTRYVGQQKTPQIWSGQCLKNSVNGKWYFPNNPDSGHLFSITY